MKHDIFVIDGFAINLNIFEDENGHIVEDRNFIEGLQTEDFTLISEIGKKTGREESINEN